jgi:preprotein translocase subunit SecA
VENRVVTIATNMAGRGTDIKLFWSKAAWISNRWTERHDSRRRPPVAWSCRTSRRSGSSQFYVSLEDNLMRLFGSERVKWWTEWDYRGRRSDSASMMTKSIERARKGRRKQLCVRKRLLEYDDDECTTWSRLQTSSSCLFWERLKLDIAKHVLRHCELIRPKKAANNFKNLNWINSLFLLLHQLLKVNSANWRDGTYR